MRYFEKIFEQFENDIHHKKSEYKLVDIRRVAHKKVNLKNIESLN